MMFLLGKFWPYIAIGLAALALLGYIGYLKHEVTHYKTEAATIQAAYDLAVATAKAEKDQLEASNAALTKKVAVEEEAYLKVAEAHQATLLEKIKNDKELAAVKLSRNAVRVFNESKNPSGANGEGTATTNPVHDGEASTPQATLGDLLLVAAQNDASHLRCIRQVEEWQSFWSGYVENVKRAVPE